METREMGIGGLIRGAPGPCIGIVGADVFRAAVLELPPPQRGANTGAVRLALSDPAAFADGPRTAPHWQARTRSRPALVRVAHPASAAAGVLCAALSGLQQPVLPE